MKPTLAFMGAVLVVTATGALLSRAIRSHDGASVSSWILLKSAEFFEQETTPDHTLVPGFEPDSISVRRELGVFVPNLGQVHHDVYFQLISRDQVAKLGATTIGIERLFSGGTQRTNASDVIVRFIGANRRPEVRATAQSDRRLTYVRNRMGSEYTTSVPLFSEVTYENLYEGVDLRISASEARVVRSFVIRPGTPASKVLLRYEGAFDPVLMDSGDLRIEAANDLILSYRSPLAYQDIEGQRVPVEIHYELGRYGAFGFSVSDYDLGRPLVIEVDGV